MLKSIGKLILNLFVFIVSIAITLATIEMGIILFAKYKKFQIKKSTKVVSFQESTNNYLTFDEDLGWRLKSNFSDATMHIDSYGFRSSDVNLRESLKGKRAVILLGDSMVFGYGIDQPHIFSEILNQRAGEYYFLNTGVPMYSPWQEYLSIKENLKRVRPEKVIIFFFEPNDLLFSTRTDYFHPGVKLENDQFSYEKAKRSYEVSDYKLTNTYTLLDTYLLHGKDVHYLVNNIDLVIRKRNSNVWQVQEKIYDEIAKLSKANHFEVSIIDIPSRCEVKSSFCTWKPHDLLKELCFRNGFSYFDLRRFYPYDYENLLIPNDEHWNQEGHVWIADFVEKNITKSQKPVNETPNQVTS